MGKSVLDELSQIEEDNPRTRGKFSGGIKVDLTTGSKCMKNTLLGLNAFFFLLAIILIAVGAWAANSSTLSTMAGSANGLAGGIVAMGVFVMVISVLGCCGAFRESPCLLRIYVVVLALVALIQFILGIVVASKNPDDLVSNTWMYANNQLKVDLQNQFSCCGLLSYNSTDAGIPCPDLNVDPTSKQPCLVVLKNDVKQYTAGLAAVGILFALFECTGLVGALWLSRDLRRQSMEQSANEENVY